MPEQSPDAGTAAALADAISAAGGKQADLATLLGCAQQTVSKLLTGEIPMTADWALRIERAAGIDAGRLYEPLAGRRTSIPDQQSTPERVAS